MTRVTWTRRQAAQVSYTSSCVEKTYPKGLCAAVGMLDPARLATRRSASVDACCAHLLFGFDLAVLEERRLIVLIRADHAAEVTKPNRN